MTSSEPTVPEETTPSEGATLPLLPRPTAPPTAPSDVPTPVVVRGEVVAPSSDGCVELRTDATTFALALPEGTSVAVGDVLRVTGTPAPQLRTPCQGTVLRVSEVAPG